MAFKASYNKGWSINRVVKRLVGTLISLWVGGVIVTQIGAVMNSTCSPFYAGLKLIGWTVTSGICSENGYQTTANTITSTTASAGVLSIIGLIGIASVVLEFVNFRM